MNRATYGVMADFASEQSYLAALKSVRKEGYRRIDTFTPYGVVREDDVVPRPRSPVAAIMLAAGLTGGSGAFFMQWYATRVYWINVGGRPVFSWPAFIPITFELSVLGAAFGAVLGMMALNGLPEPYHPLFNVPAFQLASRDKFFLCIESRDGQFDLEKTRAFLEELKPTSVAEVSP